MIARELHSWPGAENGSSKEQGAVNKVVCKGAQQEECTGAWRAGLAVVRDGVELAGRLDLSSLGW